MHSPENQVYTSLRGLRLRFAGSPAFHFRFAVFLGRQLADDPQRQYFTFYGCGRFYIPGTDAPRLTPARSPALRGTGTVHASGTRSPSCLWNPAVFSYKLGRYAAFFPALRYGCRGRITHED